VSDQLQQPSPVQIQMQPAQTPGFDIYAMLLQAHTSSLQNTADMRNHLRECNDRDSRNTQMFVETKTMNTKLFERMETHKHTLEESVNKLAEDVAKQNKWLFMIVGGITLGGVLLEKVNFLTLFAHG